MNGTEPAIVGFGGLPLVAIVAGCLFLEEIGLPLFFAPGDLLLGLGGIAIASGRVSPLLFVPAVFVATLSGALVGRELFALLGPERLMKVARRLHVEKPLLRTTVLIERHGWRAVFVARLIPGLRVHTTEIAGVMRVPRKQFVFGLVPATILYVAVFVGLGAALGHPLIALLSQGEHKLLVLVAFAAGALGLLIMLRWSGQQAIRYLEIGDWKAAFRRSPTAAELALVPAAIGIDYGGHALAAAAHLPLFLDSIGTVLAALIAGPWIGGFAGLSANLISSSTFDPIAAPYSLVSLGIGFAAGLVARRDWRRPAIAAFALWALCFWVATLASTPLNLLINRGRNGVPLGDWIYSSLIALHLPGAVAAFVGEAAIDLPDKLITVLIAFLIYQALPRLGKEKVGHRSTTHRIINSGDSGGAAAASGSQAWLRRYRTTESL